MTGVVSDLHRLTGPVFSNKGVYLLHGATTYHLTRPEGIFTVDELVSDVVDGLPVDRWYRLPYGAVDGLTACWVMGLTRLSMEPVTVLATRPFVHGVVYQTDGGGYYRTREEAEEAVHGSSEVKPLAVVTAQGFDDEGPLSPHHFLGILFLVGDDFYRSSDLARQKGSYEDNSTGGLWQAYLVSMASPIPLEEPIPVSRFRREDIMAYLVTGNGLETPYNLMLLGKVPFPWRSPTRVVP